MSEAHCINDVLPLKCECVSVFFFFITIAILFSSDRFYIRFSIREIMHQKMCATCSILCVTSNFIVSVACWCRVCTITVAVVLFCADFLMRMDRLKAPTLDAQRTHQTPMRRCFSDLKYDVNECDMQSRRQRHNLL